MCGITQKMITAMMGTSGCCWAENADDYVDEEGLRSHGIIALGAMPSLSLFLCRAATRNRRI